MSRPLYETEANLSAEQRVADAVGAHLGRKPMKLPIRYGLDYALERDDGIVTAFMEVKVRKYSMAEIDKMGGYMIGLGKWMDAERLCSLTVRPFILAVDAGGAVHYAVIRDFKLGPLSGREVRFSGRADRNDWQDKEPVVLVPVEEFNALHLDKLMPYL